MLGALRHRGPDGSGIWEDDSVSLAMRRLSIIDLVGGQQPLFNEDKSLVIVGNGEIYNYIELSRLVRRRGHKPRTGSDIELVLHLYEDEGIGCVKRLRGMFALALYDKKKQILYLIRDRMGEKPIYWSEINSQLVFSSELKSILTVKGINKSLNLTAIDDYFHYYFVPEPQTPFSRINKIPAAHYLMIDIRQGKKKLIRYWHPDQIEEKSRTNPTEAIRQVFTDACRLTLRADVPVGISLSGGLDSSAILAVSAREYKDQLKAFSIGYKGNPVSDERQFARSLTQKLGVEFYEMEISTREVVDGFPTLVADADDPIADIAAHSIREVSRLAHNQGMKVLVGGLGGDELFWGYDWMRQVTADNIDKNKGNFYESTRSFRQANQFLKRLYTSDFKNELPLHQLNQNVYKNKFQQAKSSLDQIRDGWLVSNCLALADRLSMSASIEMRSPFLDYKLAELVLSNRNTVFGYSQPGKYWFKRALNGILPEEVLNRPKRGFTPPVASWLFGIIKKYVHLLDGGFLVSNNIVNLLAIKSLRQFWWTMPGYWYPIYQLILLEIWGREFVNGVEAVDII